MKETKNPIKIGHLNTEVLVEKWIKFFEIDLGHKFREIKIINRYKCQKTGLIYYDPEDAAGTSDLYIKLQRFSWYYLKEKWEFEYVKKIIKKDKNVLEIGCGSGHFLKKISNISRILCGVDISIELTHGNTLGENIFFYKSLDDLKKKNSEKFDYITMFQVLEHINKPFELILQCLELLNKDGYIIISVPNSDVLRSIDPNYEMILDLPPHHMSHWNESILFALSTILPIKCLHIIKEPLQINHINWISINWIRNKMHKIGVNETIARVLVNRFSMLPLYFFLIIGGRYLFDGHTILGVFQKTNE